MKKLALPLLIAGALLAQSAVAADNNRSISYLASWGVNWGMEEEMAATKVDTLLLAFGQWDANGNIQSSDQIASIPSDIYNVPLSYKVWTQFKTNNQNNKVLIAFGGETYEHIWGVMNTPESREKIASGLAALLQTNFPVYQMVGSTYTQTGTTQIDGIDFDFEKAQPLTEKENDDLLQLAKLLRQKIAGLPSKKMMILTTYHTGADPVECKDPTVFENCSFVEPGRSQHHGTVLPILHGGKDVFDLFNVMAYDAGPRFKYDVAMANYARAVGNKAKVILGNTINSQWGPEGRYYEDYQTNLNRSAWQAREGYGGFFAWSLAGTNPQYGNAEQVSYINAMKEAADNAAQGTINQAPVARANYPAVVVGAADHVELDGSASSDPEGSPLTYKWEQLSGPVVTLVNSTQMKASFSLNSAAQDQSLRFRLTVNDGEKESAPFEFTIKHQAEQGAENLPPVAAATATPKDLTEGRVTLDGSGSVDPEGEQLTYKWIQLTGKTVQLVNADKVQATFNLDKTSQSDNLQFQLTVNDGKQNSLPASVVIIHRASSTEPEEPGQVAGWVLGKAYAAGDKVLGRDGSIYECRGDNGRNGWCGLASVYEPGAGWAWHEAWNLTK
ncbi:glycoside hydrolase family 18 protein [Pantoea cypripedii]|uniref:GH18 domain-containing protein n=1 Tax=Pantoea cypripedii TaxID=55209 RepID=A0A6B9G636_PANCY|nr:glycoside hydrolase family 18 protein [Pantoea cypripedii]QGY32252.1 hypothetical protein CUN67_25000 [Pantoea cypripedii]